MTTTDPVETDSSKALFSQPREGEVTVARSVVDKNVQSGVQILSSLRKLMSRETFLGAISIYGKARYTLDNYEHLVSMMLDGDTGTALPSASTMRKFVFPRLVKDNFVESSIETFPFKSNYCTRSRKSKTSNKQSECVVVRPTSWAKIDISSLHILREIACVKQCRCSPKFGSSDLRVESSNHVVRRAENSRNNSTLWANDKGVPVPTSVGMLIRIHTSTGGVLDDVHNSVPGFHYFESKFRGEVCAAFDVQVVSTLHVRNNAERGVHMEEGLSPVFNDDRFKQAYDKCLHYLETLCRVTHTSTSASPHHPEQQSNDQPQT